MAWRQAKDVEQTVRGAERPALDFEAIYNAHISHVWRFLRYLGIPERDLEDVAHDVFVVVYRRLESYDPGRPPRPWISGIAHRVASEYRRRARNRREMMVDQVHAVDDGPGAEGQLASARARALLAEALQRLDPDQRAVFILHEIEEHPVPEVAGILEIPLNTAYSRLRRGRARFAEAAKRLRARRGGRS
jgi:RNA polymerase sigma-70 factor (ECF subfamily)